MKNAFKVLMLGTILAAGTTVFGQATAEECTAIYDKYVAERRGPELSKMESGLAAAKQYLEKCKEVADKAPEEYINKDIPKLEAKITAKRNDEQIFQPFNIAVPGKDWAKAFSLGKQIVNINPDDVDVPLILASIGFDNAVANPPVDTHNADAINMAKLALQKMEQGKGSGTGNYGAFIYVYKNQTCADGKLNATGWMNYTIGNIMYYRQNLKKEALPYLYKATQIGCETKNNAEIYRTIGAWYVDEFRKIEDEKNAVYKKLQDLEKVTPPDPTFPDVEKKYNELVALQKGYMERIMDAYARAYKIALPGKGTTEYKNGLLNNAKRFYGFRYTDMSGYDAWYTNISNKPFPDPTSAVTPVIEATPTTTTGTPGSMAVSSDTTTAPSATDTRPRTAPTTAATTTTTAKTAATGTSATTTKAPAKKPAPKKKGTR